MKDVISEHYKKYSKPLMAELLELLKLDKIYDKAEGDFLYYKNKDKEEEILDLVGGYGSLLLGHNNQELVDYLLQLYNKKTPIHAQLSIRSGSAILSKKLSDIIEDKSNKTYISTFTNSGAEAVEAAIKHSYLSYRNKTKACYNSLEKAFLNIENYFNKYENDFSVLFDNRQYVNLQVFKTAIFEANNNAVKLNKLKILASQKSFHGKTIAALAITSNPLFREPFLSDEQFETIFFNWNEEEIENYIIQNEYVFLLPEISPKGKINVKHIKQNCITGIIIEPILGEGGIHVVPYELLRFLRKKATLEDIPLIFDEIQCGFYRTGEFLASFKANVFADYYVMGKSLGGGVAKISALIIDSEKYISEFGMTHTSTFAEDDISSLISLKTFDIAEFHKKDVVKMGSYIIDKLLGIQQKYSEIISDVRGDGLMIGISFKDFSLNQCSGFQLLYRANYLGYVISAFLLNKKNIRVSVTLSDSATIRIHPSLFISKKSVDKFIVAMDELCYILHCSDLYSLVDFMLDEDIQNLRPIQNFGQKDIVLEDATNIKSQVGFLVHYIDSNSIRESIPSFEILDDESLQKLMRMFMPFAQPVLLGRNCIMNLQGEKILISFIGLPFTSKMVKDDLSNSRNTIKQYRNLCNKAIHYLNSNDISIIGLGQFTSIIMQNGKAVDNSRVVVTSGNSFTVHTSLMAIKTEIKRKQYNQMKIAIVGAGGNIATVISYGLIDNCDSIVLVGSSANSENKIKEHALCLLKQIFKKILTNKNSESKLENIFFTSNLFLAVKHNETLMDSDSLWDLYIDEFGNNPPIEITWDLNHLKSCDVIVAATNQGAPFLESKHFKNGAFICDISIPSNCKKELLENKNMTVIHGGLVSLPNNESLHLKGLPLKKGQAFACMSETILMGFEQSEKSFSFGELMISQVNEIGKIGHKHGFK